MGGCCQKRELAFCNLLLFIYMLYIYIFFNFIHLIIMEQNTRKTQRNWLEISMKIYIYT